MGINDFRKRLASLHFWNALIVTLLVLSGLVMFSGYWREILGEARAGIKWLHVIIGLVSIIPVIYYMPHITRHWKQLEGKAWQRFNVIVVLLLLISWLLSGVLLWQFHAVGPAVTNFALRVHDLLTWIGLPFLIYHSLSKLGQLKEPQLHRSGEEDCRVSEHKTLPLYTRKAFIRTAITAGLTIALGPSLIKWIRGLGLGQELQTNLEGTNKLTPAATPLPDSAPPIGGGANGKFRSYSVTRLPYFNNDNWSFTIDGQVEKPVTWNWGQFVALKRSVQVSDFHCVTGWSVYENTWEGLPLSELLNKTRVKAQARVVKFYSGDGVYTDSLTLKQADMGDVIIAVLHDGKPIPNDLGGPVRLIIPQMYAYKSVKWLNRIELIAEDHVGYWGERGYEHDAWLPGQTGST